MWLIEFLPDWIFSAALLIGIFFFVSSYLAKFVPFIGTYATIIRVASLAIICGSLWMLGGIAVENKWQQRVLELQAKIAEAEAKASQANADLADKLSKNKEKIVTKTNTVVQYVDREVVKYDTTCVIPKEFISVHNEAATK